MNSRIGRQAEYKLGTLYDELPSTILNKRAQISFKADAIVRLK